MAALAAFKKKREEEKINLPKRLSMDPPKAAPVPVIQPEVVHANPFIEE